MNTTVFAPIYLPDSNYTSVLQVKDDIESTDRYIQYLRSQISNLIHITEPQKFVDADDCGNKFGVMEWLDMKTNQILEELEYNIVKKFKLDTILENWNATHDPKTGYAYDSDGLPFNDIHECVRMFTSYGNTVSKTTGEVYLDTADNLEPRTQFQRDIDITKNDSD